MDDRQRQYLQAMGIALWRSRPPALESTGSDHSAERLTMKSSELNLGIDEPDREPPQSAALDWEALAEAVENCQACPLHTTRTRAVFGVGHRSADWLILGEAPGADEDRLGEPFVGRAGQLLDLMLQALELQRADVYIANILKSRPPNNRDPSAAEVKACWPYLQRQVELIEPKLILAMGRIAAQTLLDTTTPVGKLRGRVHHLDSWNRPLIVTYHPAYLLRSPREKRKSWDDLQFARRTMEALG